MSNESQKYLSKEQFYSHLLDIEMVRVLYNVVDNIGMDEFAAFAARAYGFCKDLLRNTTMSDNHLDNTEATAEFFRSLKILACNLQEDTEPESFLFMGKAGGNVHNMAAWIAFFSDQGNPYQLVHSVALCVQQTCIEVLNSENAAEVREILKWVEDFTVSLHAFDLKQVNKDFQSKVHV